MVVVEPFRCQYTLAVLSDPVHMVRSRTSANWAITSWWATLPQSSKSLLVIVPVGLEKDTSKSCMRFENGWRHKYGWTVPSSEGIKKTPPIPVPAASQAPITAGVVGMISEILVGREERSRASQRKSSRKPWAALVSRNRGLVGSSWRNAS